jgi:hypothetical protein
MMHKLPYLFFASSLVGIAACATDNSEPTVTPTDVNTQLAQTNGGFTTADEAPEFGIPEEFTAANIEVEGANANDTMSANPAVTGVMAVPTVEARDVVVMWGHIPAGSGGELRDWSGSLTLSRGAMIVQRTIAFEANDHLDLPRTSPLSVSFTSHTKPASDGVALRIWDDSASAAPLTLTYQSAVDATQTYVIDLTALDAGPVIIDAGGGDKVVAVDLKEPAAVCDGGFMHGRFRALAPGLGFYLGHVLDRTGQVIGHVRGIYGKGMIYGKFIDLEGHFVGIINGTYDATDDFNARWISLQGDRGLIHGHYFDDPTVDGGFFLARWAETVCTQDGGGSGSGSASGGGSGSGGPTTGSGV